MENIKVPISCIRVVIILSASNSTLRKSGIRPFLNVIRKSLDDGVETIYISALGSKRDIARQITSSITDLRVQYIVKKEYNHISDDGRRVRGVFFECSIYKE